MRKLISYKFNIDTGCIELKCADASSFAIDCTAVENQIKHLSMKLRKFHS